MTLPPRRPVFALAGLALAALGLAGPAGAAPDRPRVVVHVEDESACVVAGDVARAVEGRLPDDVDPKTVEVSVVVTAEQWERTVAVRSRVRGRSFEHHLRLVASTCKDAPALIAAKVVRDAQPLLDDDGSRAVTDHRGGEAPETKPEAPVPAAPLDEVGFWERYFPLSIDDPLVPALEDNWVWFVVGGLFATTGGHLWVPAFVGVLQDDEPAPAGYYPAALKILAAHLLPHAIVFGALFCAIPTIIFPPAFIVLFLAGWLANACVNVPLFFVNSLWLTPVALVNEYNRRAKVDASYEPPRRRGRVVDAQRY